MKAAIVITIKNEERLLRQNILYHLGIGISRFFVYLDGTTDDSEGVLDDFKTNVSVQNSVPAEKYENEQDLKKFWVNAEDHHTARQCLNTYDALQLCRKEGIDWLISLDADELFVCSQTNDVSLEQFFEKATAQKADLVHLHPLELINRKMQYQDVMAEETLFKTKKNFKSKLDQIFQKIYNPYTNDYLVTSYWMGQTMGKAALNVKSDLIPHNVHRYKIRGGKKVKKTIRGNVLHYHMYDFEDFLKKFKNFKNRADTFLSGKEIENFKSLWIKLVNDPEKSDGYIRKYYKENLLYTPKKINRLKKTRVFNILKRKEKALIEVTGPKNILSKMYK